MKQTIPRLAVLMSAVLYGIIEGTHVTFGPPTLFQTFILNYHLPMAGIMLIICWGFKAFQTVPAWILLEDITFWLASGRTLDASSWVSMGFGGVHFTSSMFLPWTYIGLLALWMFLEWIEYRRSHRSISPTQSER